MVGETAAAGRHAIELLDDAAAGDPERIWLRGARRLSFGEAAAGTHAVAAWLRGRGLVPGDRLLIATANHADSIVAALGALRCGVTFAFLHDAIRPFGFRQIVEQVEPACVVLDAGTAALGAVVPGLPRISVGGASIPAATPMAAVLAGSGGARVESVRTDPLALVYTSGSTGAPRGVMLSHDNVCFTTAAIQARLGYRSADVVGLFLPLSFDYGLYQVFLSLAARASLHCGTLDAVPLRLVDTLEQEGVTVLPGVPLLSLALLHMMERAPRPLPRLRALTNTGERLPPSTVERLRALLPGLDVYLMYGLTECKRVSILLPEELLAHPDSVGRPLDGTTVEVIAPGGAVAPAGTSGELVVRGPHVTMGYWRAAEETTLRFRDAIGGARTLFTGDTFRRDADGFLYFEGRHDAQVKHRGFRISLLDIESAALALPGVAGAVAVPSADGELDLFVAGGDPALTAGAVLRGLRERLEAYKIPDRIHVQPSLPTTPHGKADRQRLRELAARSRP
jgi:acyl-coenzyme A synthetase/AMP-(fatty) acid ligase